MGPAPTLIQTAVDELPAALRSLVSAHLSRLGKPYDENDWVTAPEPGWTSLPKVLAGSDFIARTLASQPQLLTQLTSPGTIARSRQPGELRRQIEAISGDREYVASTLRQLRQQEIVRIGWRDLAGLAPLSEVLRTLSELADAAIDCALTCAHNEVRERYGEPIGAQSGEPVQLTILALGKLGGQELNLSSDVDLVFVYRESGQTDGPKSISNHEFFIKVGQILIAILESPSAAGIVFRTDMRLRPNGDSGPLALSFDAMDHYFVTHGRDWERYALIKARPVAGDVGAGVTLLDNLRPFVYRKYLDFGAFEAIRKMKALIERQLIRQNLKDNVKLGRGGIREIEFAVQSHQLIYGGRNPDLQTPGFYTALAALENAGVFEPDECQMLRDHYGFLRALEHRLQIMDDAQTHTVPINSLDRERIALSIGCNSTQDFNSKLTTVNNSVHELFRAVFRQDGPGEDEDSDSMAGDLWHATVDTKTGIAQLATLGFTETERVHRLLANTR
ncbi:MAG: bifunctional [glutamate--ammonia ligase]-adenylyl-L-tyrosine phosphorylase/[glutamate--ammonia-ligase] adenylyltransferase, partial [Acidiferrobacteraceae bacterium]|nr:bifunctional [glutamate--ammonia ligase]-adenylyl-L-tyrosine phosphorylase/[glutamate--ammonia-ligase] adenylyltransferase [Acidiferrobacteraceae bacterium]